MQTNLRNFPDPFQHNIALTSQLIEIRKWKQDFEAELRSLEREYVDRRAEHYPNPELYGKIVLIREILGKGVP